MIRLLSAFTLTLALTTHSTCALTTSQGQLWDFEPDAWSRGNTSDTSWFGWDVMEVLGPPTGPFGSYLLNDATPDLGVGTSATDTRLAQSVASQAIYGHLSGSGNYYSGWPAAAFADDTLSGVAPASGSGGSTTLLLQVIGQPESGIADVEFNLPGTWSPSTAIYCEQPDGTGLYWQEWTSVGDNVPFSIEITSSSPHTSIDAFQVDTFWTSDSTPVINSRTALDCVPEPSACLLLGLALAGLGLSARSRN